MIPIPARKGNQLEGRWITEPSSKARKRKIQLIDVQLLRTPSCKHGTRGTMFQPQCGPSRKHIGW